ncbi:MAG TPA: tetratricopeptide repeat protein [Fimbriimonadaceae bacterium]|nr:tetratricopeptide repeat protein [Fimbriimonadaceae bacterium]
MIIASLLLAAVAQSQSSPQRLLGADEVLREMKIPIAKKGSTPLQFFTAESASLRAKLPGLSPSAAATAWVGLVRQWEERELERSANSPSDQSWNEVMKALPGPDSWPAIRQGLAKLPAARTAPMLALMDDLLGNDAAVLKFLENKRIALSKLPESDRPWDPFGELASSELPIALRSGNLDLVAGICLRKAKAGGFDWPGCPDMVRIFGREKAEPLMRAMLESQKTSSYSFQGEETQALARKIVLADLPKLKFPRWDMVRGLDDDAFVSAMVSRFGEKSLESSGTAQLTYALGLAKAGKLDDALRVLTSGQSPQQYWSIDPGQQQAVYALASNLLDRKLIPTLVPLYVSAARSVGRSDEAAQRVATWLDSPAFAAGAARADLLTLKASLEAEAGRVDQAIADYETAIGLPSPGSQEGGLGAARQLLAIAVATRNAEAVDFVAKASRSLGVGGSQIDLFEAYDRIGRIEAAQQASLSSMGDTHNVNIGAEGQGRLLNAYPGPGAQLAKLYYEANQPGEIVTLLREYPKWGSADLIDILSQRPAGNTRDYYYGSEAKRGEPLGFYAAWALGQTGEKETAIRILHALIPSHPDDDAPYDLLNRTEGSAALAFYDQFVREDPFEARPLIWRGDLEMKAGKPQEAEKDVRAGIALDPMDAAAASTSRQMAYKVLADILDAQGRQAEAETCRKVYRGAGLEQKGEEDENAGLRSLALTDYENALRESPEDAQARLRLAGLLSDLGRDPEAQTEYERAAEFVLTTEGPVRGAGWSDYQTLSGRKTILKVFARLKEQHPSDPGLLMAYGEVSESHEALKCLEKAVSIAPRYLRAWHGILEEWRDSDATKAQIREAALAVIRLTPLDRRGLDAVAEFGDYAAVWRAYEKASKFLPPLPHGPLYALEASARSLKGGMRPADEGAFGTPYQSDFLRDGLGKEFAGLRELQILFP